MKTYEVKGKLKLPAGTQYKGVKDGWYVYYHPLYNKYWLIKKTIFNTLFVKEIKGECQC